MRLRLLRAPTLFALTTLMLAPSCGGGSSGDQTTKFVGPWTFSSGELTPTGSCPITTSFALKGIAVTFAKVDDSTISLGIGAACTVKFTVSGAKATVEPNQTCTLDFGAPLGAVAVAVKTWTLALSGDSIDNTIVGVAGGFCTASGMAVLTRGASDGGTHDAATHEVAATETGGDTGVSDATEAGAADGGANETGAADGGANETGADTGPADAGMTEVSATDAGAEAGD